ncbi:MAG: hypothetical protein DME41_06220 [Verrucomicrobia bacterium]|nr:MAG: hypothetical protein DME41_06220 [Verrucomicrobiota bacterium]
MPHGARYWKFIFSPSKVQKLLVKQTPLAKALFWEGILVVAKRKNGIAKQLVPDAVSMAGDGKVDKIKAGGRSTSPRKKSPPRKKLAPEKTDPDPRLFHIRATPPIRPSGRRKFRLAGSQATASIRNTPLAL